MKKSNLQRKKKQRESFISGHLTSQGREKITHRHFLQRNVHTSVPKL